MKKGRPPSDLRRLLIEAALEILSDPDTPLELRKVAEAAEKSRTAPYLVFGKEKEGGGLAALRMAVAAEGAGMLARRMDEARLSAEDPRLAFDLVARAFLSFAVENERLFRLMFGPEIGTIPLSEVSETLRHPEFDNLKRARMAAEHVVDRVVRDAQDAKLLPSGSSLEHTMGAWAIMLGIAFSLLDPVLEAAGVDVTVEDGATSAARLVMGASAEPLTRAALALLSAQEEKDGGVADADLGARKLDAPARWSLASDPRDAPSSPAADFDSVSPPDSTTTPGPTAFSPPIAPTASPGATGRERPGSPETPPPGSLRARRAPSGDEPPAKPRGSWNERGEWQASGGRSEGDPERGDGEELDTDRETSLEAYSRATRAISGHTSLRRAALVSSVLRGAKILWVDDHPKANLWERRTLEELGVRVAPAWSTKVALERLEEEAFDLVISDIEREGDPQAGVKALAELRRVAPEIPVIFYVGRVDPARGVPAGASGITNQVDELLHLVLDVLERRRL